MEASNEEIPARRAALNAAITSRPPPPPQPRLLHRDALLDALQALYDECTIDHLLKTDPQIAEFVAKHKSTIFSMKQMRVNPADFAIKSVIGRGHYGEVHLVHEKQTGDIYAMKTIKKSDCVQHTQFDVERNIMAVNTSQWLTSLQYAFQDNTNLYFIMEFHPGGDLLALLYRQGGTLPETAATFFISELVLALDDLHQMGYVHRDIKPDNILLDRCGHLKLVDFGSAARLNEAGVVGEKAAPVGTPDYVAPEVLQCVENTKSGKRSPTYGVSCDYWSLGVLAYELVVGKSPFASQTTTATYSKIINFANNLKFPSDCLLTQAYISFCRALITDAKNRLNAKQIKEHQIFKNIHFDSLRDQVPPFVPKISALDDTSNFTDILPKKNTPNIESFKRKMQFSGRNLPFIGFTFMQENIVNIEKSMRYSNGKDEIIKSLKAQLEEAKRDLEKFEGFEADKLSLERKVLEKGQKLENIEGVRNKLERELASSIAECAAVKRTLEIERKDRTELEKKALDLIKCAKIKWETIERQKIETLQLEIDQQSEKIIQLTTTNTLLNEQMQRAFKMENKHRESLDIVEKLSRRSVVGLESRLEQMTIESKETLQSLKNQLSDARHEKVKLVSKIDKYHENEIQLKLKCQQSEEKYDKLLLQVDDAELTMRKLVAKVKQLENEMSSLDNYKKQLSDVYKLLENEKLTVQIVEKQNQQLKIDNQTIDTLKSQIECQKVQINEKEHKLVELEAKLYETNEKVVKFEQQIKSNEIVKSDNEHLNELKLKLWKLEKEYTNCKIDRRIVERELKECQNELNQAKIEIDKLSNQLQTNRKQNEIALLELNGINENVSMDLIKLQEKIKCYEECANNEKDKFNEEKLIVNELKNVILEKEKTIKDLNGKLNGLLVEKKIVQNRCEDYESEKNRLLDELGVAKKSQQQLLNEVESMKKQLENTQLNLGALREACTLLENQVLEYEKLNLKIQTEKSNLSQNIESLVNNLCKAKEQIQEANKLTNEEKSLRLRTETQLKRSNDEIEELQIETDSYKAQSTQYRDLSNKLSDNLTELEEKCTNYELTLKSYERQIDDFVCDNNQLKEEVSQLLTQIGLMKGTSFKLKQQINDFKVNERGLYEKINDLERLFNQKVAFYEERELKFDSTVKQQTKLIDYLQIKIDEQSQKKKTLTDKLFGSHSSKKENQPPLNLTLNYKDLEIQLQKFRRQNTELHDEIYRLKSELINRVTIDTPNKTNPTKKYQREFLSPNTKLAIEQLTTGAPSVDITRQNSLERMSHQIPHRFDTKLSIKLQMCQQCNEMIQLGRQMNVCNECQMIVHSNCVSNVKQMCGLPKAYIDHYRATLLKVKNQQIDTYQTNDNQIDTIDGPVKLLNKKQQWIDCHAHLNANCLQFLSNINNSLIDELKLDDLTLRKRIVMEPLASEIGVNIASSDLTFVLKIDLINETNCWPISTIVFMTLTLPERDKWFKALEKRFNCDDQSTYNLKTCLKPPPDFYINTIFDLTPTVRLYATDNGLYSTTNDSQLLKIENVLRVERMTHVPKTNQIVFIANTNNTLITSDFQHLYDLTQCAPCTVPKLTYKMIQIANLDSFHFLHASQNERLFCTANSKQLVIVKFDNNEFQPIRIMDTAEPVQCGLFTDYTLIVGADKYFEIDLSTFKAEEFLDVSDTNLRQAIKCYKMRSFPFGIHQLSINPIEYLLSFNEFCIIVDEYGRSSRPNFELKPSYLPFGYEYLPPYLYIVHFGGVEVVKMGLRDDDDDEKSIFMVDVENVRLLGRAKRGIYLWHCGEVKVLEGRNVDCNVSEVDEEEEEEEEEEGGKVEGEEFSFTSSMVQSLDELSDDESSKSNGKKSVHFSHTNL